MATVRGNDFPDKTGRILKPGDFVIYGHALGRCAGLQYGRVLEITKSKGHYGSPPRPKLRVQAVALDDNYDFEDDEWTRKRQAAPDYKRCSLLKPSTLSFPSRILWVTRDQIPDDVLKALKDV